MNARKHTLLILFLWRILTKIKADKKASVHCQGAEQGGLVKVLGCRGLTEHRVAGGQGSPWTRDLCT